MVGSSLKSAETSGLAPMRSPLESVNVAFGFVDRR
jgi:hypothetical protein